MKWFLVVVGVLAILFGLAVFANARSAVHEIEAMIAFVVFAVCFSGAGVISAVESLRPKPVPAPPPMPRQA
jgi:uncharacterized membrane protein HdeD (DUF308 family)